MLAHRVDHRGDPEDPKALCLGAAAVGQHEMGIARLARDLGCRDDTGPGIDRRRIDPTKWAGREAPIALSAGEKDETFFREEPDPRRPLQMRVRRTRHRSRWAALHVDGHRVAECHRISQVLEIPRFALHEPYSASWDAEGFTLVAYDGAIASIARLASAIEQGDFAVWINRIDDPLFERRGLVLARISRLEPDAIRALHDADADADALEAADRATGVRERTRDRGMRTPWGAIPPSLSVRWSPDAIPTQHEVIYWLTSHDRAIPSGWYTVETLDRWAETGVLNADDRLPALWGCRTRRTVKPRKDHE